VITHVTIAQQLRARENRLFLAVTIAIGIVAGLSAVLFSLGIERVSHALFGMEPSRLRLFLVPPLVSIATGILLIKIPEVRGSGIPQTETAFHLQEGVIPARVPIGKYLLGILCIGSGHSLGREGPSVQIGAGLASLLGRWIGLSPARVKELVPVGAAAALSAAFNTPVAAVLFALEEIIGDMNAPLIGSTVVASVSSVIVERSILGNQPLFHVPTYHLEHPAELLAYVLLGVAGGIVSLAFSKGLLGLRALFLSLPRSTRIFQPAIGGLLIGAILLFVPQVMGVGYEYVDQALNGGLAFRMLAILCVVKLAATVISYSSGNAGGIFAPSLYIGAMAGGAVGVFVRHFAPFPTADPGAYALVGMGTVFAGAVRAPMTSVFMIFEITQDYQILVPLMVANMLSFAIARRFQHTPIYHALLEQDHIHLPSAGSRSAGRAWTALSVMEPADPIASPETSVEEAWRALEPTGREAMLAGSPGRIEGIVTAEDLRTAVEKGRLEEAIGPLMRAEFPHVHPDHALDVVMERFGESPGLLPVVSRGNIRQVQGVITLADIRRFARKQ
jgi:chloride channel protein, CIC family